MTPNPYEDITKTDLRKRTQVAIDQGGYNSVEPVSVDLPSESELKGKLVGDLQTLDSNNVRTLYYVRTLGDKAVPQWLVNLALASHQVPDCQFYIVVDERSEVLENSCQACGAGLLLLTERDTLEVLVPYKVPESNERKLKFEAKVKAARRRMEAKLKLNSDSLSENFRQVRENTAGMSRRKREEYSNNVVNSQEAWSKWADVISAKLDVAVASGDEELLEEINVLIEQGANASNEDRDRA